MIIYTHPSSQFDHLRNGKAKTSTHKAQKGSKPNHRAFYQSPTALADLGISKNIL